MADDEIKKLGKLAVSRLRRRLLRRRLKFLSTP